VVILGCVLEDGEDDPNAGRAPLGERDRKRYEEARKKIREQLGKRAAECIALLQQLGLTIDDLQKAVDNQVPFDAKASTITAQEAGVFRGERPSEPAAARSYDFVANSPIWQGLFKNESGRLAVSQLGGPEVYYRPGGIFSTQSVKPSRVAHEALHNLGKTDEEIQRAWGLPTSGQGTDNISQMLKDKKCVKD
jgi:hypothetical protein